ncbi:phosphoethanolamine transferase [Flammeovirga kamogawensis]|uniref:Phosphoethanolamine transferase n=1 Tax=Flammeovirga kamogawensis TaxID=373891 RepID=A0ABX8GT18_9BACT|nr:phosphoethanolamine transferase [Flammeovirga kamogawensis]MBB6464074.1 glucan phosphoethanolaminetransferase (alkaline phosphatase superfamily) [Flammeovirga kamogawensis]QWG06554.1 phosphoethanolamine transferase [Flammeovirga kamogawensis]TRX68381.1 phosphoethanolamine transferase [Flammeovirga kamogawensis]
MSFKLKGFYIFKIIFISFIIYLALASYDLGWLILSEKIHVKQLNTMRVPLHPLFGSLLLLLLLLNLLIINLPILFIIISVPLIIINTLGIINYTINLSPLNPEIIYAIINSNIYESYEYIEQYIVTITVVISIQSFLYYLIIKNYYLIIDFGKKIIYKFISTTLLIFSFSLVLSYHYLEIRNLNYPLSIVESLRDLHKESSKNNKREKKINEYPLDVTLNNNINTNIILVLGESSRKDHWGIYGYKNNTTPFLFKKDIIKYNNTISNATNTYRSVPLILSKALSTSFNDINKVPSILSYYRKALYTTFYLNSGPRQNFRLDLSILDSYKYESNEYFYAPYINNHIGTAYDNQLVNKLKQLIKQNKTSSNLFILQCSGSHLNYKNRYPKEFIKFTNSDINSINEYDNSILYTDYVLNNLITFIDKSTKPSILVYVSDHGENLFDDRRQLGGHGGFATRYQLEVPLFFYPNKRYINTYSEKIKNIKKNKNIFFETQYLFHTLLDIGNINSPDLVEEYSLTSNYISLPKKHLIYDPTFSEKNIISYQNVLKRDSLFLK